jgi:hypothetical protein
MTPMECPVCGSEAKLVGTGDYGERIRISCVRCREFRISRTALGLLQTQRDRAILSRAIFAGQRVGPAPEYDQVLVKQILDSTSVPTPHEQLDLLLSHVGNAAGEDHAKSITVRREALQAITGALSDDSAREIMHHAKRSALADYSNPSGNTYSLSLTMAGWDRYYELTRKRVQTSVAFMAMPFGNESLDRVYLSTFKPAVAETGFRLQRLDEQPEAGLIDNLLRVEIRRSRFLISDLTGANPGAYWEAGFAEGIGIPVIYTCESNHFKQERTHFDANHHQTVIWDADDLEPAAQKLKAVIRATLPGEAILSDADE